MASFARPSSMVRCELSSFVVLSAIVDVPSATFFWASSSFACAANGSVTSATPGTAAAAVRAEATASFCASVNGWPSVVWKTTCPLPRAATGNDCCRSSTTCWAGMSFSVMFGESVGLRAATSPTDATSTTAHTISTRPACAATHRPTR